MQGNLAQQQRRISHEDLELLAAISASGSLSGAARRLKVDHSTAFRRLGNLETRLGVRLFERGRDGYVPTQAGELAVETARRVLADLEGLERQLAGEDLRPSGTVRVTTTDTLVAFLGPVLAAFRQAHPEIILEMIVAMQFLTLTRRDADVAIRPATDPGDSLVGRRVSRVAYAVYRRRGGRKARVASANQAEWVGFEDSLAHIGAAKWMAVHVPAERIVHRGNSMLAVHAAVRSGIGVAPLPCFMGDEDPALARTGGLISELETPLWLLTHPDLRRVARVRTVLDFFAEELTRLRGVLEGSRDAKS